MDKRCKVACTVCTAVCKKYMLNEICNFKIKKCKEIGECDLLYNLIDSLSDTNTLIEWLKKYHSKHYVLLKLMGDIK